MSKNPQNISGRPMPMMPGPKTGVAYMENGIDVSHSINRIGPKTALGANGEAYILQERMTKITALSGEVLNELVTRLAPYINKHSGVEDSSRPTPVHNSDYFSILLTNADGIEDNLAGIIALLGRLEL